MTSFNLLKRCNKESPNKGLLPIRFPRGKAPGYPGDENMSKMIILSISVLLVSVLIIVSCKGKNSKSSTKLEEVSTEIDLRNFKPFLIGIAPLIDSGFTNSEIDMILDEFQNMKSGSENNYNFTIKYNGVESIMKINSSNLTFVIEFEVLCFEQLTRLTFIP